MNDDILDRGVRLCRCCAALGLAAIAGAASAATLTVTDTTGRPLATAKVREIAAAPRKLDTSDHGYPAPGKVNVVDVDITRFTDGAGQASWADRGVAVTYLARKPGYRDASVTVPAGQAEARVALEAETDPLALAEAKPTNV